MRALATTLAGACLSLLCVAASFSGTGVDDLRLTLEGDAVAVAGGSFPYHFTLANEGSAPIIGLTHEEYQEYSGLAISSTSDDTTDLAPGESVTFDGGFDVVDSAPGEMLIVRITVVYPDRTRLVATMQTPVVAAEGDEPDTPQTGEVVLHDPPLPEAEPAEPASEAAQPDAPDASEIEVLGVKLTKDGEPALADTGADTRGLALTATALLAAGLAAAGISRRSRPRRPAAAARPR